MGLLQPETEGKIVGLEWYDDFIQEASLRVLADTLTTYLWSHIFRVASLSSKLKTAFIAPSVGCSEKQGKMCVVTAQFKKTRGQLFSIVSFIKFGGK